MKSLIALCLIFAAQAAYSVGIDFEELASGETPTPIVSQGFRFSADDSHFILSSAGFTTQALYFCPWCNLTIEDVSGDNFRLNAFSFDTALDYGNSISITGYYDGGGSITENLTVNFAEQYFEFGNAWDNLTHVVIDGNDLSIGNGIDNIIVNGVPVPAAIWLFGSALAGLGFLRRK